ncbi:general transcription and DNA repair factor IIH subunit TFB5-like [Beta vulgaris subsp. vulgaris]|uniref:general transcription and DNA repair factor IIH subunit TFB5-like n=1 Tax=Beta vulgaris subsp. vulgaris TaxID=3555 RepID=UPI002036925F|nr:general transcription and DNA repair factor IIH subunit TFB5-like [Beta vulgaris subsp. vulgaris]
MVNATKGFFIFCDIPMAQFIIHMNVHCQQNQKFIIRVLDNTHLFVQPHAAEMIRSAMSEFKEANTYKKPP